MSKKLSIIVVNYGKSDLLLNFLNSVRQSSDSTLIHEIIVVDNGYPHKGDSRDVVDTSSFPFKIKFVQNPKTSYSSGVNQGATLASGDTLVIANNDIEWLPGFSIQPLVEHLWQEPCIGIVGPQLVYPGGTLQRSYGRFPSLKWALISLTMLDSLWHGIIAWAFRHGWLPKRPKMVGYVSGAFMVVRRSCFEELGGFNEDYSFYGEDTDFCWRAHRHEWKVVLVPTVHAIHIGGASSTLEALKDYTVQLLKAKQKFVKEHLGYRRAIWYNWLMKVAFLERAILYSFAASLIRSSNWRSRAQQAKDRYDAVKGI
ncbi:glycosyltransferase [Thermodesulfovibrionales bacterium]|nr:glycosyltransferase [Thermodesulfovibrionales bacterium]